MGDNGELVIDVPILEGPRKKILFIEYNTYESRTLICFLVLVDVDRVDEDTWVHLLHFAFKLDHAW